MIQVPKFNHLQLWLVLLSVCHTKEPTEIKLYSFLVWEHVTQSVYVGLIWLATNKWHTKHYKVWFDTKLVIKKSIFLPLRNTKIFSILLKKYSLSGHSRWFCFFARTDLEKFSIESLAHQRILCSEWVPSDWEHNNPVIHITPVHQLTSCEVKCGLFFKPLLQGYCFFQWKFI